MAFFSQTFILKVNVHVFRGYILVKPGASRVKKKRILREERDKENMTEKKRMNYQRDECR